MTVQLPGLSARLREMYYGHSPSSRRFRFGLLVFDLLTIVFFVLSSMFVPTRTIYIIDLVLGAVLLIEYIARMSTTHRPWKFVFRFASIMDAVVIISLFIPFLIDNLTFLRVARMLRLLRSYHVAYDLRQTSLWFRRNEDVIISAINLIVFVFVITAVVFVVEGHRNANINNYFDALYFTVSTLTTTGFGDITMSDTPGRILSVLIMVFGVSLFLRLIQTIFRPAKRHFPCPECGLQRHEVDAVHCKHCGILLKIPTDGD